MAKRFTKEMDDISRCCICTELYTNPKVLPCIHTFCLTCLETYAKDKDPGETESCPLCRQEFIIPQGGLPQLPNNFLISQMIEARKLFSQDTQQQQLSCDLCLEENETDPNKAAIWQCLDCAENLCDQCRKIHQKSRSGKNHKVFKIGKQNEHLLKIRPTFCEEHPDEVIKLYCLDSKQVICMKCLAIHHQNHKCEDINNMADKFRDMIQRDIDTIGKKDEKWQEGVDVCEKEKISLLEQIVQNENKISNKHKELIKLLQIQTNCLYQQLENEKGKIAKEIELKKEDISRELLMLESFKRYSQEVTEKATSADICRVAEDLHTRAGQLQDMKHISVAPSPVISFSPSDVVEDLIKYQNVLGTISVGNSQVGTISGLYIILRRY